MKVEDFSPIPNAEGFASMAGDPNLIALGSMAMPNFHPNFSLAFGGGLIQPMQQMNFLGASPGFHAVGQPHNGQYLYGYGPGFAAMHHATANGGEAGTPGYRSNDDGSADGEGGHRRPRPMSGMTPLVFAGMPASFQAARGPMGYEGNFHPVMQVVSTDSQADDGNGTTTRVRMVPMGNVVVPLQQPKKWVRWSEHEDQILGRAVEQYGENNFRHISEQIFHGSRTEVQCKNRWKKVRYIIFHPIFDARDTPFTCVTDVPKFRRSNPDSSRVDGRRKRTISSPDASPPGTTSGPKSPSDFPVASESRSRSVG